MLTIATGNKAVAAAAKAAGPGVIAAYPITPQTEIVEQLASYVTEGSLDADYIPVESEHSAMAACIGASAAGARTFTATSSHGLLYMHEMLHWAAGARTPVVMANVNRALGPGWNTWAEHTDAFSQRDTGWLQVFVGTVQEAYDATLMAFRIAEDERVLLPVMVNLDGFTLSHITQSLETVEVGDFIPPFRLPHAIDVAHPRGYGTLTAAGRLLQVPLGHGAVHAGVEGRDPRDGGRVRAPLRPGVRPDRGLPLRGRGRGRGRARAPSARRPRSRSTSSARRG